jgi:putative Mg2+ transporter-C (MgtC) family protein
MAADIIPLTHGDLLLRIVLAALVGVVIGWEREKVNRPAGLRTYALVCVGSALFTILSIDAFGAADPSRIAAQIITGIGFLGAGTIFKYKNKVLGLTTAAGLWAIAGVGMGFGAGYYFATSIAAIIIFFLLRFNKASTTRRIVEHEVMEIKEETKKFTHLHRLSKRKRAETKKRHLPK